MPALLYLHGGGWVAGSVDTHDGVYAALAAEANAVVASVQYRRGLPPAHVIVAGLDPLHDEGVTLAKRLRDDGVEASLVDEPTLVLAFLRASPFVRRAREARQAAARAAGDALRRSVA